MVRYCLNYGHVLKNYSVQILFLQNLQSSGDLPSSSASGGSGVPAYVPFLCGLNSVKQASVDT